MVNKYLTGKLVPSPSKEFFPKESYFSQIPINSSGFFSFPEYSSAFPLNIT